MAEVKWIKLTTDIFDDEKILMIESLPSADTLIVIWFKLLTFAGKSNNNGVFMMNNRVPYTEDMLAAIFRRDLNSVKLALTTFEQFGMIEIIGDTITIPNWDKHQSLDAYEKKKERDRKLQAERRARQRALIEKSSDNRLTTGDCKMTVAVSEEDKEKEIDIEKDNKSKRENTHTLFARLAEDYVISSDNHKDLYEKLNEWFKYKAERRESYKEQGMKALLRQVENNALRYGDEAVCQLIEDSMSSGWKGIIFDRLKNPNTRTTYQKQTKAEELDEFYNMAKEWSENG